MVGIFFCFKKLFSRQAMVKFKTVRTETLTTKEIFSKLLQSENNALYRATSLANAIV